MADGYMENGHYQDEKMQGGDKIPDNIDRRTSVVGERGEIVNASGHRDQLQRHYGLISICGLALTIDNAWVALGGSIAVSISTILPVIFMNCGCADAGRQWWSSRCSLRAPRGLLLLWLHRCIDSRGDKFSLELALVPLS